MSRQMLGTGGAPPSHVIPASALSRRRFLSGVGGAVGGAALAACDSAPPEKIIPYVDRPPEVVPGVGQYYATSTTRKGYGLGLLVESHAGRPTKIEGHPEHPASLGGTLAQEQAEIFSLYDPDRTKRVIERGGVRSWDAFAAAVQAPLGGAVGLPPSEVSIALLLEPTASPLIGALLEQVQARWPRARIGFEPSTAPTSRWRAGADVLGEVVDPHYQFDRTQVILALDADFLAAMPMSIRWAHDFAQGRDVEAPEVRMNRLYAVQSTLTVTAATADHYLSVRCSEVGQIAAGLLHALGEQGPELLPEALRSVAERHFNALNEHERRWLVPLARDLATHRGASAVIVGEHQPPSVHALAMALNEVLGNVGRTVRYARSALLGAGTPAYSIGPWLDALDAGDVAAAFVLGGNPAYSLPPGLRFEERWLRARERVCLSLYEHETARLCTWLLPEAHFLERWGDAVGYDGTLSLRQPLIRPLYGGRGVEEVLALLAGASRVEGRELLREHFLKHHGDAAAFELAIRSGIVPGTAYAFRSVVPSFAAVAEALRRLPPAHADERLELDLLHDLRVDDGRLTNNRWLLELPEPATKLVWDNAALIAPATAEALGVARGDVIAIEKGGRSISAPVLPAPGQAQGTIGVWFGWGRQGAESSARGVGVNVAPLRELDNPWVTKGVVVRATGQHHPLVTTQDEFSMHDRKLVLHRKKHEFLKEPHFAEHLDEPPLSILPTRSFGGPQWGMAVDLGRCTGCSACVIACQAENNVPTVGKDMVAMGREMHWLRIDAYRDGPEDHPRLLSQPMLCQHCEKAPCEYVCPVHATVHSEDGLNEMVYNRCVGTRFCSNNCPYKVRRFNYFEYNDSPPEVRRMLYNPDVTVRARGVMEKCTYCVQRLRRAQIDARLEHRPLRDGDVQTACQQVCPTDAIVFGLVSDPTSRVSEHYRNLRTYAALNDLGTQPRTRYLARIDNPNEEMPE